MVASTTSSLPPAFCPKNIQFSTTATTTLLECHFSIPCQCSNIPCTVSTVSLCTCRGPLLDEGRWRCLDAQKVIRCGGVIDTCMHQCYDSIQRFDCKIRLYSHDPTRVRPFTCTPLISSINKVTRAYVYGPNLIAMRCSIFESGPNIPLRSAIAPRHSPASIPVNRRFM